MTQTIFYHAAYLIVYYSADLILQSPSLWDRLEKFGLPTVLLLVILIYANGRDKERHKTQIEFNSYLKTVINDLKKNTCNYEKNKIREKNFD